MSKILLVEYDAMIASGITYAFETEGYETVQDDKKYIRHFTEETSGHGE